MGQTFILQCDNDKKVINRERINWVDSSRGIAFLMIIYSHIEFSNEIVVRYILPVFLTTFFFISGYLFKEKCSFNKVIEQRTRTLLIPFLLLGLIMIVLSQILTFNEKISFFDGLKGLLLQNGENQILWFISALYIYSLFFYWIDRISSTPRRLITISFLLLFINRVAVWCGLPHLSWHIDTIGFGCFYMGLGKYYKEKQQIIDKYIDNLKFVLLMCFIYFFLISIFDLHISFADGIYIMDGLSVTIPCLIIMLYISKHIIYNNRFILFVGANTLFYFAFHGKCYSLLQTICHKIISDEMLSIYGSKDLLALCIVFLDALILIFLAMFVNNYCPFLLGKGFKLWKTK